MGSLGDIPLAEPVTLPRESIATSSSDSSPDDKLPCKQMDQGWNHNQQAHAVGCA